MKILLINTPRSPHNNILKYASDEAKRFIHKKLIGPPLSLLTLAAAVPEHETIVWDTKGEYDLDPNAPELKVMVENLMNEHNPDVVGTTVITSEFYFGLEILKTAKACNPNVLTIIGGVHATLCINDFGHSFIDVVCQGQAAHLFKAVVAAKASMLPLESVPGIYINSVQGLHKTKGCVSPWNAAADNYLIPDRNLLNRWRDTYKVGDAPYPSTYMFTSLGCPYKCTFCSIWKEFEGAYLQRDLESIISELKNTDYTIVRFSDANTIVNVDFIDKLFDRIEQEQIKKMYIMDIRSDTAVKYPKLIAKLAKNGLKVVICGFESFREEELQKYNKSASASLIAQAIDVFHSNGIMLRGNYVIPHDYSLTDFKAMADYAGSHKVSYAGYTILTPMPGTVYYEEMKSKIIDFDLSKYNFFNSVLPTKLPLEDFYKEVSNLWLIKKGNDVI
ncbi:MAG: B12-binding domain-containing radical SAM protein [Bacteroidales bacterium]|nr:B12-binding domain-containing radical SAM protein [Bacteroidales bacterium]